MDQGRLDLDRDARDGSSRSDAVFHDPRRRRRRVGTASTAAAPRRRCSWARPEHGADHDDPDRLAGLRHVRRRRTAWARRATCTGSTAARIPAYSAARINSARRLGWQAYVSGSTAPTAGTSYATAIWAVQNADIANAFIVTSCGTVLPARTRSRASATLDRRLPLLRRLDVRGRVRPLPIRRAARPLQQRAPADRDRHSCRAGRCPTATGRPPPRSAAFFDADGDEAARRVARHGSPGRYGT